MQDWAAGVYDVCQWSIDPTLAPGSELVNPEELIPVEFVSDVIMHSCKTLVQVIHSYT